ncbi:hypothetical protein HY945_02100 [Candidatus Gottesmanbacteria bacterium]|nr:hypothetical protein [Candidatus Gottesmanbacteria bacterium]
MIKKAGAKSGSPRRLQEIVNTVLKVSEGKKTTWMERVTSRSEEDIVRETKTEILTASPTPRRAYRTRRGRRQQIILGWWVG